MAEYIGIGHEHPVSEAECLTHGIFRRVSWGAIFAGTVVAFVIEIILILLGIGVGLGVVNPMSPDTASGIGIGAAIWLFVTCLIALFCGGWVAGRLAGYPRYAGVLHGIVTWGLVTLLSFYLMSTAFAMVISSVSNLVGGAAAVGPSAMQGAISGSRSSGGGEASVRGREAAINSLMATGMSRKDAERTVDTVIKNIGGTAPSPVEQKQAMTATSKAMGTLSTTAILLFVAMVLEAVVSALGAALGSPKQEILEHPMAL